MSCAIVATANPSIRVKVKVNLVIIGLILRLILCADEKGFDSDVENVVLLQPTNPLRPIDLLSDCFQKYISSNLDSLFTVSQDHHKLGKIHNGTFVPFNYEIGQRSQDLEPLFFENGLLYIAKSKLILEGKIISEKAFPYIVNHVFADVDIDIQEDFDYAEYLLNKNKK